MPRPRIEMANVVLGARDARALADFYERFTGWRRTSNEPNWVTLRPSDDCTGISFQTEGHHVPPVWPTRADAQQMMTHLDIAVDDLDVGVAWALECGARLAEWQPQDDVRVMIDPAGHVFCLFLWSFEE